MVTPTILAGDCIELMRHLPENSVDAIVTDPPYGIRFMGKAWDGKDIEAKVARRRVGAPLADDPKQGANGAHASVATEAGKYDVSLKGNEAFAVWTESWARGALRVLKPGGHLLSFAAARTYQWMAVGIERAGFEARDQIMWVFGSGFPKSHNLDGAWSGWGTALKPAHEPIMVARKPLIGTVAANVLEHGTGAINIDGCRVEHVTVSDGNLALNPHLRPGINGGNGGHIFQTETHRRVGVPHQLGRWPANLIHDGSDEVRECFPAAPGQQGDLKGTGRPTSNQGRYGDLGPPQDHPARIESDTSAARFFYAAKTSSKERSSNGTVDNKHPTVKPLALMRYLVRLVTPPGGLVLDPFMGSGTTGMACIHEGFAFIGIERELEYLRIAEARMAAESKPSPA
jgi:DNA modification methylase